MHGVVETPSYLSDAERLFTGEERIAIVDRIAANPQCGVLIPDTGGIRKVRFAFGGRGKRGGARVIYFLDQEDVPIFLLAVFAKNEKADLTRAERAALAKSIKGTIAAYRSHR